MKMSNDTYDSLKIIALLVLPLAELMSSLAGIWGIPYGHQIVATLVALDVFVGAIVKMSSDNYRKEGGAE